MLVLLVALALVPGQAAEDPGLSTAIKLRDSAGADTGMIVLGRPKLEISKSAPVNRDWKFDFLTAGYVPSTTQKDKSELRFLCYSQRRPTNDPALGVVQLLLRLWHYNRRIFKIDHSPAHADRQVHVYLCDQGKAGGEQRFGEDSYIDADTNRAVNRKVNTIYIYDMPSFAKDRAEMVREIAHEYGHATLPPIGPFGKPEDWANGDLGERLYVRWLFEDLVNRKLTRGDMLGATADGLERLLKTDSDPLIRQVALNGPDLDALARKGNVSFNAYLGLALYAERIMTAASFMRTLRQTPSTKPIDYAKTVVEVASEDPWTVRIPFGFENQKIWLPAGKMSISGAKVLKRKGDWVQVQTAGKPIVIGS